MSKSDDETKPIPHQPTTTARALQLGELIERAIVLGDRAVERWGLAPQLDQLVEESAELIVAVNHWRRGRVELGEVIEELADVVVVGAGVLGWLDRHAVTEPGRGTHRVGYVLSELRLTLGRKLDRLSARLDGGL